MSINREQLMDGVTSYLQQEIVPKIPEKTPKIMFTAALKLAKKKPEMLERLAAKIDILGVVLSLLDDGTDIDIEVVLEALKEAIEEEGSLTVSLPMLKGDLEFTPVDVDILREYLVPKSTAKEATPNVNP